MSNRICNGLCPRFALTVTPEQRSPRTGLLKRFANYTKGEKRCRHCNCVFTNFFRCPCCRGTLAVGQLHGNKKKIKEIARY